MAENSMKPRIRFKGYTDAWEQRKLCGIAEKVLEKNKNTSITETFTNSAEFGIISQRDYFDHDISNINNLSDYYVVQNDDFIYNPRISANAPVGPINRNKLGRKGVMSPLYTVFRASNIDFAFLEWYFKSEHWHGFMKFNGDSGARSDRFSIKDEIMFQMPLPYPNINEQERVGKFLSKIDNLITLHQRKYDKIVNIKKALLEKMFPSDAETTPKIRFKGFTDAWEQRKLGDTIDFYSGLTYSPSDIVKDDGVFVLRSCNVQEGEIVDDDNVYVRAGAVNSDNVSVDDIIVVVRNGSRSLIGKHAKIKKNMPKTVIGAFMTGLRYKNSAYLNAVLNTSIFAREIEKDLGATINQITTGAFRKMVFPFPKQPEQSLIGNFFEQLDNLITLHQRQLEKLKNIKSALLEKMFV